VVNQRDLAPAWAADALGGAVVAVSALTGEGMDALRAALLSAIRGTESPRDVPAVTNLRHLDLLARAREALVRAATAAADGVPEEFVLADLNEARGLLEEMTGARTADDLLTSIFAKFCIGK
jgi:tRNA modification GTPase